MVTISLRQAVAGDWCVRRGQITLFSNLQLGAAIKLAREMARDEHERLGHRVRVEMPGPSSVIVLAYYAGDGDDDGSSSDAAVTLVA
jgi:hypothetical protein